MQSEGSGAASTVFAANRARGAVAFDVRAEAGVTRRGQLHESGSLRVRFPSPEDAGLSGVFVNTAGGIASGDRFSIAVRAGAGSRLTLTSAAAEKIYRSEGLISELDVQLEVAEGAHLAWLPQETILFDAARIARNIEIDLAPGASLLMSEMVVFGRAAMGERMSRGAFTDRWRVRRDGRLIYAETVRLEGDLVRQLSRPAVAAGGAAVATVLIVPGDEALIGKIRDNSGGFGGEVGLSSWNGFAMARFCAQDAARLRADLAAVLTLASGGGLPRLWLN